MPARADSSVKRTYDRLAGIYDLIFGAVLQPGRVQAVRSVSPTRPRVLEVGIGTALTAPLYPPDWRVTGVDLSQRMLLKGQERIARLHREDSVRLVMADGARLPFDDGCFDVVLAPYVMSVVPHPVQVGRELRRVCHPSGRIIMVNHFSSEHRIGAAIEHWISPFTRHIGFRTDLPLGWLLRGAGLRPIETTKVNAFGLWTLVQCEPVA